MLGDKGSHRWPESWHPGHRFFEEAALLFQREMLLKVIAERGKACLQGGTFRGVWRSLRGEGPSGGGEPIEKILVLRQHMTQDHRIGTVDRGHRTISE